MMCKYTLLDQPKLQQGKYGKSLCCCMSGWFRLRLRRVLFPAELDMCGQSSSRSAFSSASLAAVPFVGGRGIVLSSLSEVLKSCIPFPFRSACSCMA